MTTPRKAAAPKADGGAMVQRAVQLALLEDGQRDMKHSLGNLQGSVNGLGKLVTDKFDAFRDALEVMRREMLTQRTDLERKIDDVEKRSMPRDALIKLLLQAGTILTIISVLVNLGMRVSLK